MNQLKESVLTLIKQRSVLNPIKSATLEHLNTISGAKVRDIVRELRQEGCLVGSISKKEEQRGGYYYIKTRTELEITLQHLRSRISSMQHTISAMENALRAKDELELDLQLSLI